MENNRRTIGILGCGWLGFPLAKSLLKKGYPVKGTTTSINKIPVLRSAGVIPYQIKIAPEGVEGDIQGFLEHVDVLIIDIPPGLRKEPEKDFAGGIRHLKYEIMKAGLRKVIFVSSTSVFKETENFTIYTEDTAPNDNSVSSKQMIAAEKVLLDQPAIQATVVRFGGLIGPDRHPVYFLAGRSDIANPLGPVNLIHQTDCIGIIERIVEKERFGQVYNAVFPLNPPREKYYKVKAKIRGLRIPKFGSTKPSVGKVISSAKVMRDLEYQFQEEI